MSETFTWALVALLAANVGVSLWLAARQMRHVAQHRGAVPAAYANSISLADHQKAADYTRAKLQLGLVGLALGAATFMGWTLFGGLNWLNQTLLGWMGAGLAQQVALVVGFALIGSLIELPLSLYSTFELEGRFGFNKMSWQLWLSDTLKGLALSAVLMLPLLAAVLWLMGAAGSLWWLWAWALVMVFSVFVMAIAPNWIMPLYNKFTPLDNDAVKSRAEALMQRCGFAAKGFFVMDGSRRSAHSNAFFTGFGRTKRVVFFDTLLEQLSAGEMEAVLAHELGHFTHRHLIKRMAKGALFAGLGLFALGWLSNQVWFYTGAGVMPQMSGRNDALALLLFMLTVPLATFFLDPLGSRGSRRDEFEADAFAAQHAQAADLQSALLKLYKDNASTLTPDPWYVRWYYSHPPATERFARLQGANA